MLITSAEIKLRVQNLAAQIHADYKGKRPVLVCTLKGACPFFAALAEALQDLRQGFDMEFVRVSSYEGTRSTGIVSTVGELNLESIKNRHVLVVEDIVDTGQTLATLMPLLREQGKPSSAHVISLIDKRLEQGCKCYVAKYVGFSIPDAFIVGFGLDYNELYRDVKDIFVISLKGIEFDSSQLYE